MKTLCVILLLLFTLTLNGQETFKRHIGINVMGQRELVEVQTDQRFIIFLFVPMGVSYSQSFRYFNLRANVNYLKLKEVTSRYTRDCYTCYTGTAKLEGLELKMGIQKQIKYRSFSFLGGLDLVYSSLSYQGKSLWGPGYFMDEINERKVLNPYLGLGYSPHRRILLTVETGVYKGYIKTRDLKNSKTSSMQELSWHPLQALTVYWNFR